jgi:hypothetical protein
LSHFSKRVRPSTDGPAPYCTPAPTFAAYVGVPPRGAPGPRPGGIELGGSGPLSSVSNAIDLRDTSSEEDVGDWSSDSESDGDGRGPRQVGASGGLGGGRIIAGAAPVSVEYVPCLGAGAGCGDGSGSRGGQSASTVTRDAAGGLERSGHVSAAEVHRRVLSLLVEAGPEGLVDSSVASLYKKAYGSGLYGDLGVVVVLRDFMLALPGVVEEASADRVVVSMQPRWQPSGGQEHAHTPMLDEVQVRQLRDVIGASGSSGCVVGQLLAAYRHR